MKNVLVTGGSGFIGKRLQRIMPSWNYVSSSDYSLDSYDAVKKMYQEINPDAVVHLASIVGGIRANKNNPVDFFEKNILINLNVIKGAFSHNVKRVLASLSTCVFPEIANKYPLDESMIFDGKPPQTNISYAISKRALFVHCNAYRDKFGLNYSTFSPSNVYGPGDHFSDPDSHFIPSLIRKLSNASSEDEIEMWGTGAPMRQQLYVDDLAKIIPMLLEKHHTSSPIIVAPQENLTIDKMCEIGNKISKKNVKFIFNGKLDGQFRKDGSNAHLKSLIGDFKFTSFEQGFKNTYTEYNKLND
jgi:GDP-L-fucose synthase